MKRVVSVVLLSVVLLAGCGDDEGGTATDPGSSDSASTGTSPSADPTDEATGEPTDLETMPSVVPDPVPDWPACADVWVADAKLPGDYKGCLEGETPVKAENQYCEFGKKLVTYADQYWAVRGGKVNDAGGPLGDSADYAADLESCLG